MDSDGTLIIHFGELSGGTRETLRFCERLGKPALTVDGAKESAEAAAEKAIDFITNHRVSVLNVAGPRESTHTGAAEYAKRVMSEILQRECPLCG